jgi:cob(I)alamin adenosyltransferase
MPKIYTKTGDYGETGLYDGSRIMKNESVFDFLGTSDELSSHIGLLIANLGLTSIDLVLRDIQQTLQDINSIIATPSKIPDDSTLDKIDCTKLEAQIDKWDKILEPLTAFILPGGVNKCESQAHICRTVARRLEREYYRLDVQYENINKYINRLSDFFFTLARVYS